MLPQKRFIVGTSIGFAYYEYPRISLTLMEVFGTDGNIYTCTQAHFSDDAKKPITGMYWSQYWQLGGSIGGVWVPGVTYGVPTSSTNRKVIEYDVYFRAAPGGQSSFVDASGVSMFVSPGVQIKVWNQQTRQTELKTYLAASSSEADILAKKREYVRDIIEEAIIKYSTNIPGHKLSVQFSGNIYDTQSDGPSLTSTGKSIICVGYGQSPAAIISYQDGQIGRDYHAFKLWLGGNAQGDTATLHEFLHGMGFAHTFGENTGLSYTGMPMVYGIADNGYCSEIKAFETNEINNRPGSTENCLAGLDYLYENGDYRVVRIVGYAGDCYQDFDANAYIVSATTNEIWYETPIDKNGYYEFNLRNAPSSIKVLLVSSGFGSKHNTYHTINYWLSNAFIPPTSSPPGAFYDVGNHKLDKVVRCNARFKLLRDITKIKLMSKIA